MSPTVRDAMSTTIVTVRRHAKLAELRTLFEERGFRHLPVVDDDGALVGLVTHRDLASRALGPLSWLGSDEVERQAAEMEALEVMTSPVSSTTPDVALDVAARRMVDEKLDCLPVVEGGRLVGVLTEGDFVRIVAGHKPLSA